MKSSRQLNSANNRNRSKPTSTGTYSSVEKWQGSPPGLSSGKIATIGRQMENNTVFPEPGASSPKAAIHSLAAKSVLSGSQNAKQILFDPLQCKVAPNGIIDSSPFSSIFTKYGLNFLSASSKPTNMMSCTQKLKSSWVALCASRHRRDQNQSSKYHFLVIFQPL